MNRLIEHPSPFLVRNMRDYLVANGFRPKVAEYNAMHYYKDDMQLRIVNDTMVVRRWQDGDDDRSAGYREEQRINHISALDEVQWFFLLDALGIVRVKDAYKRASLQEKLAMRAALDEITEAA